MDLRQAQLQWLKGRTFLRASGPSRFIGAQNIKAPIAIPSLHNQSFCFCQVSSCSRSLNS